MAGLRAAKPLGTALHEEGEGGLEGEVGPGQVEAEIHQPQVVGGQREPEGSAPRPQERGEAPGLGRHCRAPRGVDPQGGEVEPAHQRIVRLPLEAGMGEGRAGLGEGQARRKGIHEKVAAGRQLRRIHAIEHHEIVNPRVPGQSGSRGRARGDEHVGERGERALQVEVAFRVEGDSKRFVDAEHREGPVVRGEVVIVVEVGAGATRCASGEGDHQGAPASGRQAHLLFEDGALVEPDSRGHHEVVRAEVPDREQDLEAVPGPRLPAEVEAGDGHVRAGEPTT